MMTLKPLTALCALGLAISGCAPSTTGSAFDAAAISACQTAFSEKGSSGTPTIIAHSTLVVNANLGRALKGNTMTAEQTATTHHLDRMLAATVSAGGSTTATGPVFTRFLDAMNSNDDWTVEQYTLTAQGATGECLVAFEKGASTPLLPAVITAA